MSTTVFTKNANVQGLKEQVHINTYNTEICMVLELYIKDSLLMNIISIIQKQTESVTT